MEWISLIFIFEKKIMKSFIYTLILIIPIFLLSCSSDPEEEMTEVCDNLTDEVLHGTWTVDGLPTEGQVTLNSDGTLIDDNNIVILYSMGGVSADFKTWSRDDREVTFSAAFEDGPGSESKSVSSNITDFECNKLTFDGIFGFTFTK